MTLCAGTAAKRAEKSLMLANAGELYTGGHASYGKRRALASGVSTVARVQARWKQKSCILRCPGCSRKLVVEFVGSYKVRYPSKAELRAAGVLDTPSQESTISYAPARENDHPEGET